MKFRDIEIKGVKVAVHVEESGKFVAELGDSHGQIRADVYENLIVKLTKALQVKKAKVNVPIIRWKGDAMQHGAFTGIHASTGNLLLSIDGVRGVEQIWPHDSGRQFINPEREKEYLVVCKAYVDARNALEDFEREHHLNIRKLLTEALNSVEQK